MTGAPMPSLFRACDSCGVAVPDRRDLHRVRNAGHSRHVCPTCAQRLANAGRGRRAALSFVIVVLPLALLAGVSPVLTMADVALILLSLLGAIALHVAAHEAAHALVALTLGMGVPQVKLGEGPVLVRLRLGGTNVELRGFHSGVTQVEPSDPALLRVRLALVVAAGPLVNLAIAAAVFLLVDAPSGVADSFAWNIWVVGAFVGLANLVPLRLRSGIGVVQTDGWALLTLLRSNRESSDQILAASRLQAAHRQHLAGAVVPVLEDPPVRGGDAVTLGMEGTRRILTREYDEAVALLRESVSMPQKDDTRALSLNNLAWALLLSQPAGWLDEADRASAAALAIKPWLEALMGTRGCVLEHLGQPAEARDLLRRAVQADPGPHDLVVLHRHLLRAEQGLGNLYAARGSLLALVENGAEPAEIEAARALLRPLEVDNALANLVDADGRISWPDPRSAGTEAEHLKEIRRALETFLDLAGDDLRRDAVQCALTT